MSDPRNTFDVPGTEFEKILQNQAKYFCIWNIMKYFEVQSTLVIVYLVIVESLDIVDRAVWPIVYFSMFLSRNSGISCNSGQFLGDQKIHYYECRLYNFLESNHS